MSKSRGAKSLRAEEFRVSAEDRPGWVRGSVRTPDVGQEVYCAGGPGEDSVDWLTTIEDWVERDVAPDSVVATKRAQDGGVVSTRVVQEYLP